MVLLQAKDKKIQAKMIQSMTGFGKADVVFNGKKIAEKGTLVELHEDAYRFKNIEGNEMNIRNNKIFENRLLPISDNEYQLSLSESFIKKSKKFSEFKDIFESLGYRNK